MRTVIWIAAAVFVAIYVAIAFATVDHSSDQAQIDALIARGVAATQSKDLTAVVSCISPNYKDDALKYDQLRMVLGQAFHNESDFVVSTSNQNSEIKGDQATVRLNVTLRHTGGAQFYSRDLTLKLAKEDDRHMLVAPAKVWRVVGSANLGLVVGDTTL